MISNWENFRVWEFGSDRVTLLRVLWTVTCQLTLGVATGNEFPHGAPVFPDSAVLSAGEQVRQTLLASFQQHRTTQNPWDSVRPHLLVGWGSHRPDQAADWALEAWKWDREGGHLWKPAAFLNEMFVPQATSLGYIPPNPFHSNLVLEEI